MQLWMLIKRLFYKGGWEIKAELRNNGRKDELTLFNGPFCLGHPPQEVNQRMMTKQECVCGDAGRLRASLQHDLAELFC